MKAKSKKFHLVFYVEDCKPKYKKFLDKKKLLAFVSKFNKKYSYCLAQDTGYWIDHIVTGVTGNFVWDFKVLGSFG